MGESFSKPVVEDDEVTNSARRWQQGWARPGAGVWIALGELDPRATVG